MHNIVSQLASLSDHTVFIFGNETSLEVFHSPKRPLPPWRNPCYPLPLLRTVPHPSQTSKALLCQPLPANDPQYLYQKLTPPSSLILSHQGLDETIKSRTWIQHTSKHGSLHPPLKKILRKRHLVNHGHNNSSLRLPIIPRHFRAMLQTTRPQTAYGQETGVSCESQQRELRTTRRGEGRNRRNCTTGPPDDC